ncbi:MAG: CRISPR-associated endonuclease Cas2 [Bacteroidales bacterium]|jgi:CRISPR-associated protein Cas2|nr:CRISPR-associated endonuclease Cas2 [Bacteroidales bacterium]MCK9499985.1 CRISPR-associated endonuclease Cas2 [Bacteroidales bacterium]MDY0315542.1 CRISPR-associated endonuclease Cas2 [Bacteroidales bacterium]NLB87190.1 CRISPR-associated endonuclease Cas2 [Bacteroidales bacterium]
MKQLRLNAYHIMWLFVYFDLPTNTKKERKAASLFRKNLLKDGFTMMQFSVYVRHCASKESSDVHIKRVSSFVPDYGMVSILQITDKQYGNMINFWGKKQTVTKKQPVQLELF